MYAIDINIIINDNAVCAIEPASFIIVSFSWGTPVAVIYCISIKYLTAFLVLFNYPPSTHSFCEARRTHRIQTKPPTMAFPLVWE